ncbi:hypothetical protein E1264_36525 [Actinomadura sp. KC216]|uniref:S53 family peptidase n=1 Tax=Actinomadura sp. KC216 TaxID=2530370 RepID=UPI0010507A36|nr:S53 family peptidase [Actinomadura sp. KC216]TDB78746.1 hypothetical protein E1264_36525 [Actinomadura sp. KC216]
MPTKPTTAALTSVAVLGISAAAFALATGTGPVSRQAAPAGASTPAAAASIARQLAAGVLPLRGPRRITHADLNAARALAPTTGSLTNPSASPTTGTGPGTGKAPPTTAECRAAYGAPCYSVRQLARAYGVNGAHRAGWTGRGATVVLPIWHSVPEKTLRHDLGVFSAAYGLPKVDLEYRATGPITPMPPPDAPDAPWRYAIAEETVLDASMIHAMAPHARIVAIATPETPTDGGYADILDAVRDYAAAHPGAIVSMSYGTYESDLPTATLTRLNQQLSQIISARKLTVTVSNGDTGNTSGQSTAPNVPWPASSPDVLAVGGTQVDLDDHGRRRSPDTVWGDPHGLGRATGGGLSKVFTRPAFQDRYAHLVGGHRGTSDVAANGSGDSRMIIYSTYNVLQGKINRDGGWWPAAGTSVSAPLWAGVLGLVRQAARQPLGRINPALYGLVAATGTRTGIADVTQGSNAVPGNPGFPAGLKWDVPSGNGTIGNARWLVPALAIAARRTST